ncbi:hypothetical protein L208DRAFT_1348855 [Tricholoma matsutake]|nr:hypothetical protein L208DRAFT_1348855 [Tricholoma matsutake 945]
MFGLGNKAKALYGGQVNSLHNVITMAITLHSKFDTFNLWLEPVPGQYTVPTPSHVTFSVEPSAAATTETMNRELTLPDPALIAIHAVCAYVINLSGAAEQADQILRDMENTTVLSKDGSC